MSAVEDYFRDAIHGHAVTKRLAIQMPLDFAKAMLKKTSGSPIEWGTVDVGGRVFALAIAGGEVIGADEVKEVTPAECGEVIDG